MFSTKQDLTESEDKSYDGDRTGNTFGHFRTDASIFTTENNRRDDLHLQLSDKYMIYKDYADRSMTNPQHMGK
jgi:hypothetical protein